MRLLTIDGRLGADAKVETSKNGNGAEYLRFNLANDYYDNRTKETKTEWFNVTVFNQTLIERQKRTGFLKKGSSVWLTGDVRFEETQGNDGRLYHNKNITAYDVNYTIGGAKKEDGTQVPAAGGYQTPTTGGYQAPTTGGYQQIPTTGGYYPGGMPAEMAAPTAGQVQLQTGMPFNQPNSVPQTDPAILAAQQAAYQQMMAQQQPVQQPLQQPVQQPQVQPIAQNVAAEMANYTSMPKTETDDLPF